MKYKLFFRMIVCTVLAIGLALAGCGSLEGYSSGNSSSSSGSGCSNGNACYKEARLAGNKSYCSSPNCNVVRVPGNEYETDCNYPCSAFMYGSLVTVVTLLPQKLNAPNTLHRLLPQVVFTKHLTRLHSVREII
jgi:hypothetical protein